MDKMQIRQALDAFAQISLFGHEHTAYSNPTKRNIQLFAGAVQPSRRDPAWRPTYHILELAVAVTGGKPELVVRVSTRTFDQNKGYKFFPQRNDRDEEVDEHRIPLPPLAGSATNQAKEIASATTSDLVLSVPAPNPDPITPTPTQVAERELLVHFFRLGTPLRFASALEAGLVRDGDDTMDPQMMWDKVFQRAIDEKRSFAFWAAVAKHAPELRGKTNPFIS